MHLHYLVKLKIRVFLKILMTGKRNSRNLLIDFDITYWKRCNFLTLTSHYGKYNQESMYQTLSESTSFCQRYDKNISVCSLVHSSNCCSLAKHVCYVSQGRVKTLLGWGRKCLHFCMTNLLSTMCTKFYHNPSCFVDSMSKNILVCFFSSQCIFPQLKCQQSGFALVGFALVLTFQLLDIHISISHSPSRIICGVTELLHDVPNCGGQQMTEQNRPKCTSTHPRFTLQKSYPISLYADNFWLRYFA